MMTNDSPLMQMLGTNMRYTAQRQAVLAHNISNADTPSYRSQDLKAPDFNAMVSGSDRSPQFRNAGQLTMTNPKHMNGSIGGASSFRAQEIRDAQELTPVKNNVVLEEEMAKVSDNGAQNAISNSLMKKFTAMYRGALGQR